MSPSTERGLSRRELLVRGAAGAVLAAAGGALAGPRLAGALASGAQLSSERRSTYAALAAAVVSAPTVRLPDSAARSATQRFADAYATLPANRRAHADAALDGLGAPFRGRDRPGRLAHLRADDGSALALLDGLLGADPREPVTI